WNHILVVVPQPTRVSNGLIAKHAVSRRIRRMDDEIVVDVHTLDLWCCAGAVRASILGQSNNPSIRVGIARLHVTDVSVNLTPARIRDVNLSCAVVRARVVEYLCVAPRNFVEYTGAVVISD